MKNPTEADLHIEALTRAFADKLIALVNEFKRDNPEIGDTELLSGLTATLAIGVVQYVRGDTASIDPTIDYIAAQLRLYAHEQAKGIASGVRHARPH